MSEPASESPRAELMRRARDAFEVGGVTAAVRTLQSVADPQRAGGAFNELLQNLYQSRKDVSGMIAVAEAGLAFCRDNAAQAENDEAARRLKEAAKAITFNAGANCWPGWGDAGVAIERAHVQAGLRLAEANRDLSRELQLGPTPLANAHWLIGALKLAAGDATMAVADFEEARRLADSAGKPDLALMAAAYAALARKATPATAAGGTELLDAALGELRSRGTKEAQFFAAQIVTAERILLPA